MAGRLVVNTLNTDTVGAILTTQNGITGIAKAWVNFDGTPATPTIRSSFNVGSITKNATGNYTITFTTAFANTSYSVTGACMRSSTNTNSTSAGLNLTITGDTTYTNSFATTSLKVLSKLDNNSQEDGLAVCIAVFSA
jgi:hypothetical protein